MSPPQNASDAPPQGAAHEELSSPTPLPAGYRNFDATATEPVGIHELDRRRREHHALRRLLVGAET